MPFASATASSRRIGFWSRPARGRPCRRWTGSTRSTGSTPSRRSTWARGRARCWSSAAARGAPSSGRRSRASAPPCAWATRPSGSLRPPPAAPPPRWPPRFGARVRLVDAAERIAPLADGDASATLASALRAEGIGLDTNVFVQEVRQEGDEVVATIAPRDGSKPYERRAERVLLASGRVPNVEELELEAAGVETTKAGITVDDHLRTSAAGIWAAGDVNAVAQFTPIAQYQARVAIADMFGRDAAPADYSVLPTAIFTDPELGGVGLTEEQAREQGHDVGVARNEHVKRFQFVGAEHGLFKLVFEQGSRKLLGIHVVSRNASEIVQGLSLGLRLGATVDDLAAMHHVFPTFGEGVKAAAERTVPMMADLVDSAFMDS